jgi:uncharacterized membrane protein
MIFGFFLEGILTSSFLAGIIFLLVGRLMRRYPPKWPNYFYGYRTMSSLKTKETFDAANTFSTAFMIKYGKGLIAFGIISSIFFHEKYWWLFLSAGMGALVGCVIALVYKTEKFLKENFDKDGNPFKANAKG